MERSGASYAYKNLRCEGCDIIFDSKSRKKDQRFCTKICAGKHNENTGRMKKGDLAWNKGITGELSHSFGRVFTDERKRKIGDANTGKKQHLWKGENAGYSSIHCWVRRWFGKAKECELCGVFNKTKRIEWSNKDGLYSRDRKDWQQLCVKCHSAYDRDNGVIRTK